MFEIFKEFRFDAAHRLEVEGDPRYGRLHGHSFRARVFIRGEAHGPGWVADLGEVERLLKKIADELDHRFLNEIPELGPPTLENLAQYIGERLVPDLPGLTKVEVLRDACGEGCTYFRE
ncbi:MAG TPA: 6-pyruvoyl tetrahydropterin synthase family protein [Stellaceae bacterium]|nr:6-pyruvoyl tetrahydropterin synthase family protein [Stellaceae bacterium]